MVEITLKYLCPFVKKIGKSVISRIIDSPVAVLAPNKIAEPDAVMVQPSIERDLKVAPLPEVMLIA